MLFRTFALAHAFFRSLFSLGSRIPRRRRSGYEPSASALCSLILKLHSPVRDGARANHDSSLQAREILTAAGLKHFAIENNKSIFAKVRHAIQRRMPGKNEAAQEPRLDPTELFPERKAV